MKNENTIIPPPLLDQQKIALISPSSASAVRFPHRFTRAIAFLHALGYQTKIYAADQQTSLCDPLPTKVRTEQIHDAFSDPDVGAIICNIGGILANELLSSLNYALIAAHPKIFCGYSDITVLHYALLSRAALRTFYGPMALTQLAEYPKPMAYTVAHMLQAFRSPASLGNLTPSDIWTEEILDWSTKKDLVRARHTRDDHQLRWLRKGRAHGRLVGGCLSSVLQLRGTPFDIDYAGKILILETPESFDDMYTGMPLPYVRAQLTDLSYAGVFSQIAGLVVGRPFGYTEHEREEFDAIVNTFCTPFEFPVLLNANIGHTDPILTLPLGAMATLDSVQDQFSIDEAAVR